MNVLVITRELPDYRSEIEIQVDEVAKFSAMDGEPEDNNLGRNFQDCYGIAAMMKLAYDAGKRGEHFILVEQFENYGEDTDESTESSD